MQSILVLFCCLLSAVHTNVHTNVVEWIFIFYLFFKTVALGKTKYKWFVLAVPTDAYLSFLKGFLWKCYPSSTHLWQRAQAPEVRGVKKNEAAHSSAMRDIQGGRRAVFYQLLLSWCIAELCSIIRHDVWRCVSVFKTSPPMDQLLSQPAGPGDRSIHHIVVVLCRIGV